MKHCLIFVILIFFSFSGLSQSQYFGQNKQRNKANKFNVLQSPHFELYHYLENSKASTDFIIASEKWYKLHQEVFKMAFIKPNPIILYNTHPDFQETTAIGGEIGEGTGGVTEGFRTRVVMPLMFTKRQTDHVLGHELVHAFQYQTMTYGSDSTSLASIQNLPLFMVEGLAEYMSLGRKDSHTSMWLRDAVASNDIPSIKDLINKQYKYFPYRWGQAFWAYVTAQYGDDIIRPLFKETASIGIERAFVKAFKLDTDAFSEKFKKDLISIYTEQQKGRELKPRGLTIASEKKASEMNVSPSISPDGKFIAYISSKNILSLDIFIVDAYTGKTVRTIASGSLGSHVDSYSFIETSGTWSSDSKKFGIVIQSKSKNKFLVVDVLTGTKTDFIPDVEAFTNPAWSPDGNKIVVSGLKNGHSDLYLFDLKSKTTSNITNDEFSDIQPCWSTDGQSIHFVSDRDGVKNAIEKENFKISSINISSGKVKTCSLFPEADHMNPQVGPDARFIYFLADPDGFRNLYKYDIEKNEIIKLSNFYTGVSGITMYSPAMSVSTVTGEIAYNYFSGGDYSILKAKVSDFDEKVVSRIQDDNGSYLIQNSVQNGADIVQKNLKKNTVNISVSPEEFKNLKYNAKFKMEYLANSGLGVSTSMFGTGVGGGVTALFADMLNNNQLMGTLALNGEIQDFGGQIFYLNQKRPLQYGVSASHIPYTFGGRTAIDTISFLGNSNGLKYYNSKINQEIIRLFIDELSVFVFRPFSKYTRLEFGASANWYSFNARNYPQIGDAGLGSDGNVYDFITKQNLKAEKLNAKDFGYNGFNLRQVYAAYVGDNSTFGTVAPLNGYRYRFEVSSFSGTTSYQSILADVRKYKYLKPVTLAVRAMYNGRLNPKNLELINQFNPLYIGFPWHMHGFWNNALAKHDGKITERNLRGEQMGLGNFEIRLPFTGPKKLALIPFNYLPSDLNFFVDAGLVWSKQNKIGTEKSFASFGNNNIQFKNTPILTTGISLRVNVLGYLIVEPYLALPFYNGAKQDLVSGLNFMVPGW